MKKKKKKNKYIYTFKKSERARQKKWKNIKIINKNGFLKNQNISKLQCGALFKSAPKSAPN
jgi:hypothetical protein